MSSEYIILPGLQLSCSIVTTDKYGIILTKFQRPSHSSTKVDKTHKRTLDDAKRSG